MKGYEDRNLRRRRPRDWELGLIHSSERARDHRILAGCHMKGESAFREKSVPSWKAWRGFRDFGDPGLSSHLSFHRIRPSVGETSSTVRAVWYQQFEGDCRGTVLLQELLLLHSHSRHWSNIHR